MKNINKLCLVDGCGLNALCKNYCNRHYRRFHAGTDPAVYKRSPAGSLTCIHGHDKTYDKNNKLICKTCITNSSRKQSIKRKVVDRVNKIRNQDGKLQFNEYLKIYNKERYDNSEQNKRVVLIRSRIHHALVKYIDLGLFVRSGCVKNGWSINYENIINHLFNELIIPKDFNSVGYGMKGYSIDHIVPLRSLDLMDELEWSIAVHPLNHRWMLNSDNYKRIWDKSFESEMEILIVKDLIKRRILGDFEVDRRENELPKL
jgi:hypothetical protein